MSPPSSAEKAEELFRALGSDSRLRILQALRRGPLCVGALANRLEMTQSAVSQHLTVLRSAGLVTSDKRGTFVHYALREEVRDLCARALEDVLGSGTGRTDRRRCDDADEGGD